MVIWSPRVSKLGSMLDLVLGGPQDRFWIDFGMLLGGQDGAKTPQDGANTGHYGAKTPPRWRQDGSKTFQRRLKMHPRQLQIRKCQNLEKP